jgi:membrane protein
MRPPNRARRLLAFARSYVDEVLDDRLLGLGAETAFFAVLSIFPGLLVAGSLLGLLDAVLGADVANKAQERVLDALSLVLTDEASGVVQSVRSLFEDSRGGLLTFATVGALVSLSGAFAVAVNALNLAHDAAESRSWLRRRVVGLVMAVSTLVLAVLALAVLVVGPLLGRGERLAELVGLGAVFTFAWDVLRLPVMVAVLLLWATALLRYAPARRLRWRDALPGALAAAVLWLVATTGFRLYLAVAAAGNPVLGAFGGGAIVMTWVYLLSLSLLLGGELNAVLVQRRRDRKSGEVEQLELFEVDARRMAADEQGRDRVGAPREPSSRGQEAGGRA